MADGPGPSRRGTSRPWKHVRLVLSGGNALAAYQGGAYEALHEHDLLPDLIAGTSMGAVNAAIIASTPEPDRVARLRAFWQSLVVPSAPAWDERTQRSAKRLSAMATRVFGHARIFAPALPRFSEWMTTGRRGLYGLERLRSTLEDTIDFVALGRTPLRLVIHATDLATGDPVRFRNWDGEIGPSQLQACCALAPDADPVLVDGRLLGDGGLSINLPVEFALDPLPTEDTLCLAIDLFTPRSSRLGTLDDMYQRRLDLLLGNQSRLAIDLLRCRHALARKQGRGVGHLTIAHLVYPGTADEIGEKMFDYSAASITGRWQAGYLQMKELLARLAANEADSGDDRLVTAPA